MIISYNNGVVPIVHRICHEERKKCVVAGCCLSMSSQCIVPMSALVMRGDHRHLTAYQIGCELGQYVVLVLRPAILDRDILALDVAGFANALPECGQIACTISKRRAAEESYHRRRRL